MSKLVELQQKRASKIDAQKALVEARKNSEEGIFTEEQRKQFETLQTEIDTLQRKVEEEKSIIEFEKRNAAAKGEPKSEPKQRKEGGEAREKAEIYARASIGKALNGDGVLDGAEAELNAIGIEENRNAGVETPKRSIITIPMDALRAAQSVTGNSGLDGGEYVVKQTPRPQLPFQPNTFLEDLGATRLSGLVGGGIPLPVASKYTMAWLAENEAITVQDQEHTGPTLDPERLGGAVDISNRLLIQSSANVEQLIRGLIIRAYQTTLNGASINGAGASNEPEGILNNSDVQLSATVAAATPTWEMITELMGLVDAADVADNATRAYLMSPQVRTALMNIKKDAGSGRFIMENKTELNGYNAAVTSLVPVLSNNDVLIHGDFSKLFIGEWGALSILEDPYSASLSNAKRLVLNAHAGVAIAQGNAFAVNKFLDI